MSNLWDTDTQYQTYTVIHAWGKHGNTALSWRDSDSPVRLRVEGVVRRPVAPQAAAGPDLLTVEDEAMLRAEQEVEDLAATAARHWAFVGTKGVK